MQLRSPSRTVCLKRCGINTRSTALKGSRPLDAPPQ
ncbi:hypothetical protein MJO29_012125, partial [Puccinia striiformis f. sp. tritici]